MRIVTAVSILALSMTCVAAQAQDKVVGRAASHPLASKTPSPEESAALAEENRQKAEALERAREVKLRRATSSICSGC